MIIKRFFLQVFISYVDLMKTAAQRRAELKENWYFWCECSLCLNKERALMENCIKCGMCLFT